MTQASVPAKTTPYTISNPFAPTEMEKFFAHLNNGEVLILNHRERDELGYRIIISPKAGE